jgi:hypothetical protein
MYIFHTPAMNKWYIVHFASCCVMVIAAGDQLLSTKDWGPKMFIFLETISIFV